MEELWLPNNKLISFESWQEVINSLKSSSEIFDKDEAVAGLSERVVQAIKTRIPTKHFGVFFSGGVDSTLIAFLLKKLNANFTCYTVGFQEGNETPRDVVYARRIAEEIGFNLKYNLFDLEEARRIFDEVVMVLKKVNRLNVVTLGVGAVVLGAARLAKKDGVNSFFSGLGSEEIFAGYERHAKAEDVQEECWSGLINMWGRDLVRDAALGSHLKIVVATPFLDEEVVRYSMQICADLKINKEFKKIIIREVAESFGLPNEYAWRRKQAAQYGSSFDKAIAKLAKARNLSKGDFVSSF